MNIKHLAAGFVGIVWLTTLGGGASFALTTAAAKLMASKRASTTSSPAHGIVEAPTTSAETRKASPRPILEMEETDDALAPDSLVAPLSEETPAPTTVSVKARTAAVPTAKAPAAMKADAPNVDDLRIALAMQVDSLPMCRRADGPEGPGIAEVTIGEGRVGVRLSAPYANTPVGACVARRLGGAAARFDGSPVTLKVQFDL